MKLPTVAESREANRLGVDWGPRLRSEAALLIICADCDGALLATVTYVQGRPLAAAREQGDRLTPDRQFEPGERTRGPAYSWADRGTWLHARVGAQRHVLDLDAVLARLQSPSRRMKVRHGTAACLVP